MPARKPKGEDKPQEEAAEALPAHPALWAHVLSVPEQIRVQWPDLELR